MGDMLKGNVKGAPAGRYFREIGYSQSYPWVVTGQSESGKTLYLQGIETRPDPDFTPEILPGGFAGHCTNQHAQTWLYAGIGERTRSIRLNKHGEWGWRDTRFQETEGPYHFYDWNF